MITSFMCLTQWNHESVKYDPVWTAWMASRDYIDDSEPAKSGLLDHLSDLTKDYLTLHVDNKILFCIWNKWTFNSDLNILN